MKWSITASGKQSGFYVVDNFLSDEECKRLIQYGKKYGIKYSSFLPSKEDLQVRASVERDSYFSKIYNRISRFVGLPIDHAEPLIVLGYVKGGKVNYHNDFIPHTKEYYSLRTAQVLIYLNDVKGGGETSFLNLGVKFVPTRGRLLLWYGVQGMEPPKTNKKAITPRVLKANDYAVHSPLPIVSDETKWVAILQFYKKKYESLRKVTIVKKGEKYEIPLSHGKALEKMRHKFISIDKSSVTENEKNKVPPIDKIIYEYDQGVDFYLRPIAIRRGALIFECSKYPDTYCQETSRGEFIKILKILQSID